MSDSGIPDGGVLGGEVSSAVLAQILNSVPQAVFWKDRKSVYLGCNQALAKAAGLSSPAEIIGKTDLELSWRDQAEGLRADDREVMRSGQPKSHIIEQILLADGRQVWVETTKVPLFGSDGTVTGVLGIYQDITERKRNEEALRESEERFSQAFRLSPDSININRLSNGVYLEVNEGFLKMTGYTREEVVGRSSLPGDLGIWADKADRDRLIERLRTDGECLDLEARFRKKSGQLVHGLMSARLVPIQGEPCILSITRDVTARKQLESALREAQKMEAIGRLAGGVAHDFNNILAVFMLSLGQLRSQLPASTEVEETMSELEQAAKRATNLTQQLLQFSRRQVMQVVDTDLNEIVAHLLKMVVRLIGEEVQVNFRRHPQALRVEVDPGTIEQVVLNLCINARDAMPGGGTVVIESSAVEFLPETVASNPDARPGRFACLSVTDSGCGMDSETLTHVFEPFFTTKAVGKGTGLGLASVHGIVKQHGGWVAVTSAVGVGSRFLIYLPLKG